MKTIPKVSLELLDLVMAVVRHGTISAAARSLSIAPSLATRKIAALERELNARLFDRTTRKVLLTDAGSAVFAWAEKAMCSHGILEDHLASLQGQIRGTLKLVMNEYLCTAIMPTFLAAFSRSYPDVKFAIRMTDEMVNPDDRDYDVAIYTGKIPDSSLRGIRLVDLRRILCASPQYLASKGTPTHLAHLEKHDCLVHNQTSGGYWTFQHRNAIVRQPIRQLLIANSYLPLIEFSRQGMGIIRVSQGSVREHLESGALTRILPDYNCVHSDGSVPATWVLYPGGRMMERTRIFVSELSAYFKNNAPAKEY